jgi:hypothetical protein
MKIIDQHIDTVRLPYLAIMAISHIVYFIAFFGIRLMEDSYIHLLNIFTQTFIVGFLLFRFHPFRKEFVVKPVDLNIVFGSAILLATNLVFVEYAKLFPVLGVIPKNKTV